MKNTFAKHNGKTYAFKIEGVNPKFFSQPFGRQLDDLRKIEAFKSNATRFVVGAKRKATLQAVKNWVKEQKPTQFYACWTSDSEWYKDDCVDVYYTE